MILLAFHFDLFRKIILYDLFLVNNKIGCKYNVIIRNNKLDLTFHVFSPLQTV